MGTLVVVHGAGVRGDGIPKLEQNIRDGIAKLDPATKGAKELQALEVRTCAWGPAAGANPVRVAATLPAGLSTRAVDGEPDDDLKEAARWALLFDDPLFELRLVAQAPAASSDGVAVNDTLAADAAAGQVRALPQHADEVLPGTGITAEQLGAAANAIADSRELGDAANAIGTAADLDFAEMMARAIVAQIISGYRETPPGMAPPLVESTTIRDGFVDTIAARLVPDGTRGAMDFFKARIGDFLARKATAIAADHRLRGQEGSAGLVGDVVYYLRRGDAIAAEIAKSLEGLSRPVVALGHSLGGIVLVDVLSRSNHPPVDLLVTVGSQSPILFAYDALERSRDKRTGGEPYSSNHPPFTPWLNIYNRNDFVSFLASDIFKKELGDDGLDIVDRELHLPKAFPEAHGAYWFDQATFEFIAAEVARLPAFAVHGP